MTYISNVSKSKSLLFRKSEIVAEQSFFTLYSSCLFYKNCLQWMALKARESNIF